MSGAHQRRVALVLLLVSFAGAVTLAQRGRNRRSSQLDVEVQGNTPYDGRFTFVRLRYDSDFGGGFRRGGGPLWAHDYPDGEVHFSKILEELTLLEIRTDGSNILTLDDPELFKYPIAYMAEPGGWGVTETEATAFRSYLLKGGFAIFDDFRGGDWDNLQYQMRAVLPEATWFQLDGTSRVFHSFFEIDHPENADAPSDVWAGVRAVLLGALRAERSAKASDGRRQRQPGPERVLGILGHRDDAGRPDERSVQVRRELRDLRIDALKLPTSKGPSSQAIS